MLLRVIVLLAIAAGLVWHFQLIPPSLQASLGQAARAADSVAPAPAPAAMYKWTDANGRVVYGNAPPEGRKAERLSGERGSVSTVQATKIPPPEASKPGEQGMSLQQQAIERAIERSN